MPCANASVTKYPYYFWDKQNNNYWRTFHNCELQFSFVRDWRTKNLFENWFQSHFVPQVEKMVELGLPKKN